MKGLSNTTIIGHLGGDVELVEFNNGGKAAKFSVAVDKSYTNAKGEKVSDTQWYPVQVSGDYAEVCQKYIKKGSHVCVEGEMRSNDSGEGADKKTYWTLRASNIIFLDKKED